MSAFPDQGQFKAAVEQSFFDVATMWRGAMVDRYARVEFFVNRSLHACTKAGIAPAAQLREHLPLKRIGALLKTLEDPRLSPGAGAAIATLSSLRDGWTRRNALCHGRMRVLKASVCFDWTAYTKGVGSAQTLRLSAVEMLVALREMDHAQAILGSQLGGVDKACAVLMPAA